MTEYRKRDEKSGICWESSNIGQNHGSSAEIWRLCHNKQSFAWKPTRRSFFIKHNIANLIIIFDSVQGCYTSLLCQKIQNWCQEIYVGNIAGLSSWLLSKSKAGDMAVLRQLTRVFREHIPEQKWLEISGITLGCVIPWCIALHFN